jgi:isoleucyl-tRNA synthetase
VLTHGFTLDEKGNKMSKSLGNTIAPEEVIKQYGADILRLWVAQTDYTADQRIGPEILKGVADSYRRLRNTMRFMLGALAISPRPSASTPGRHAGAGTLGAAPAGGTRREVRAGYAAYDFQGVFQALFNFATVTCRRSISTSARTRSIATATRLRRRAARTVLDILFHRLTTWLAPILVFTMEEVWLERFPGEDSSVHLQDIPETPAEWRDDALAAKWAGPPRPPRGDRRAGGAAARDKVIGASLEAAPVVHVEDARRWRR